MPKAAKKRTDTKALPLKKKAMSSKDMKKVKGGDSMSLNFEEIKAKGTSTGLLLPAVQKIR